MPAIGIITMFLPPIERTRIETRAEVDSGGEAGLA